MSKFIDLHDEIEDDLGSTRAAIESILEWLDSHPDQTPGRTITESRYRAFTDSASEEYQAGFSDGFFFADGLVIPDPEPTNSELLEQLHDQYRMFPVQHLPGNGSLADYLDHKGVKAPDHA